VTLGVILHRCLGIPADHWAGRGAIHQMPVLNESSRRCASWAERFISLQLGHRRRTFLPRRGRLAAGVHWCHDSVTVSTRSSLWAGCGEPPHWKGGIFDGDFSFYLAGFAVTFVVGSPRSTRSSPSTLSKIAVVGTARARTALSQGVAASLNDQTLSSKPGSRSSARTMRSDHLHGVSRTMNDARHAPAAQQSGERRRWMRLRSGGSMRDTFLVCR